MRLKEITVIHKGVKQALPFHFGFNTQADFCEELGLPIQDFDKRVGGEEMRLGDIRVLAWYAMRNGHRKSVYKDAPFTITQDEVGDMFDASPGLITDIFAAIVDAQPQPSTEPTEGEVGNATKG
jgi:hypothetical protein